MAVAQRGDKKTHEFSVYVVLGDRDLVPALGQALNHDVLNPLSPSFCQDLDASLLRPR